MLVDKNKIIEGDTAQFDLVLSTHFLSANENPDTRLKSQEKYQLADCLYTMLKNVDRWDGEKTDFLIAALEKRSGLKMNPIERAEFQFTVIALDDFEGVSKLDNPLSHLLAQCRYHLLINSLVEKQFLLSHHPLKQLIDFIHNNLLGFDAKFGKVLLPLYEFVSEIVEAVRVTPWNDSLAYQKLIQKADEELKSLTERFFLIADRMVATEAGHLRAQQSKSIVTNFMVQALQGKQLPEDVSQTIFAQITDELKILLMTEGTGSARWQRLSKMLDTLIDLYQPRQQVDKKTQILWQELPDELGVVFRELNIHNPYIDKWLDTIKYDFYHLSQGMSLDSLVPINVPFDAVQDSQVLRQLDDEYTHKAKSYSEGQWFLVKQNGGEVQRAYLSLKLVDYNQYLFINILGQKIFSLDILTFSDYLKSGSLTPLIQNGVCIQLYSLAVDKILQDFYERYDNQMKAKARSEEQARQLKRDVEKKRLLQEKTEEKLALERMRLEKEAEAERRARAEALAKQRADEQREERDKAKAISEQQKREQLMIEAEQSRIRKAKDDAEAARVSEVQRQAEIQRQDQLAKQKLSEDVIRQTRLALDTLALGAKIDFIAQNGQAVRAKLAVKFNATRRYVFIDHDGFTILDAVRNDVLDLVLQGKVILIDADQQFNDKLSSVIHLIQESRSEMS